MDGGHIVLAARVNETHAIVFAIGNIFWNAPSPIVSGFILRLNTGMKIGASTDTCENTGFVQRTPAR